MSTRRQWLQGFGAAVIAASGAAPQAIAMPESDPDCVFCRIAAGTAPAVVVFRDAHCVAFATIEPLEPGHLLLAPIGHVRDIYALDPALGGHLFGVATDLARAMKPVFRPDGLTLRQNNEDAGGQTVFHFHLHLVPRTAGRELWKVTNPPLRRDAKNLARQFAPLVAHLHAR